MPFHILSLPERLGRPRDSKWKGLATPADMTWCGGACCESFHLRGSRSEIFQLALSLSCLQHIALFTLFVPATVVFSTSRRHSTAALVFFALGSGAFGMSVVGARHLPPSASERIAKLAMVRLDCVKSDLNHTKPPSESSSISPLGPCLFFPCWC
jgi:hypothetical protein